MEEEEWKETISVVWGEIKVHRGELHASSSPDKEVRQGDWSDKDRT